MQQLSPVPCTDGTSCGGVSCPGAASSKKVGPQSHLHCLATPTLRPLRQPPGHKCWGVAVPCMDPTPTPLADPRDGSRDGLAARDLSGKGIGSRLSCPLPPGPLSSGLPLSLLHRAPDAHLCWPTRSPEHMWDVNVNALRFNNIKIPVPGSPWPQLMAGRHVWPADLAVQEALFHHRRKLPWPVLVSTAHPARVLTSALLPTETSALEVLVALRAQDQASGTLCRFEPICPVFSALLFSGALQPHFPFPLARGLCWAL